MISYSDTALTISETLQTNAIVWIHSLPEQEMGPSRRILEDLESLAIVGGLPVFAYAARNRAELVDLFRQLTAKADQGLRPVLHVDAHGTAADGLLLAPSGERVGWSEIIEDLRALNVATANNLTCIFALCFGLHLYKQVSLKQPVPAYLFCAPAEEISVGSLEAQTLAFYQEMNRTSNVTAAFEATLGGVMQSFHCQGLFLQSLVRYIRTYRNGGMRQDRLERMVTAVLQRDGIENPSSAELKEARRKIRETLKPGQKVIDVFAQSFLIGRAPAFTYVDVDRFLERSVPSGNLNRARRRAER
jgi:hypothetical protein